MKKLFIIFLGIIFLVGCRSLDERNEECIENMPVEVRQYVREFLEEGEKRGKRLNLKKIRIELVKSEDFNGRYTSVEHKIRLNYSCYEYKNDLKTLLFHELGHAILKRDHNEDRDHNGIPTSYMYPEFINISYSDEYRIKMLDELFN